MKEFSFLGLLIHFRELNKVGKKKGGKNINKEKWRGEKEIRRMDNPDQVCEIQRPMRWVYKGRD